MWLKYQGKLINLGNVESVNSQDFTQGITERPYRVLFGLCSGQMASLDFKSEDGREAFLYKLGNKLVPFSPEIVEEMSDEEREAYEESLMD